MQTSVAMAAQGARVLLLPCGAAGAAQRRVALTLVECQRVHCTKFEVAHASLCVRVGMTQVREQKDAPKELLRNPLVTGYACIVWGIEMLVCRVVTLAA